ncbi:hypothetical protein G7046_g654 [Stylonectria norvegica]|nr:hypothetical protein G7046_g654 [Stylonectria norvegica]
MPVKSLVELATAACVKNIKELESVGDYLPYENVRQILLKVDNAHQLRLIEINSPHVQGDTGEVWLKIIEREFPMEYKAKAYKPQDPKKWYRVWEKYKRDHDHALEESERKLMQALGALKESKDKNTSRIVDRKYLPRAGKPPSKRGWGQRDTTTSALAFGLGSRTKTANGASVMRKVRREVKEIANIHGSLSRKTKGLAGQSQLRKAPPAMVNAYRRAAQPAFRATPRVMDPNSAMTQHEERATFISDEDEDDDEDDLEEEDGSEDEEEEERAAPMPVRKPNVRVSATSLLKKKPAAMPGRPSASSSSSSAANPITRRPGSAGTSSIPVVKRTGIFTNSLKPSASKSTTSASTTSSRPDKFSEPSRSEASVLPRTQTSPPPATSPGSSSPPPAPAPEVATRKRKPVSIFHARKKR